MSSFELQFWWEPGRQLQLLHSFPKPQPGAGRCDQQCRGPARGRHAGRQRRITDSGDGPGGLSQDHAPHPKELRALCVPGSAGCGENLKVPCKRLRRLPAGGGAVQQGQQWAEQQLPSQRRMSAVVWRLCYKGLQRGIRLMSFHINIYWYLAANSIKGCSATTFNSSSQPLVMSQGVLISDCQVTVNWKNNLHFSLEVSLLQGGRLNLRRNMLRMIFDD